MDEKRIPVSDEISYSVALVRSEREAAEKLLETVRSEDDYYKEKVVAKTVEFLRREEEMVSMLAELRRLFPTLVESLTERKPYIKTFIDQSRQGWLEVKDRR